VNYFTYQDVSSEVVSVILAQSLEDLVDSENPQNVLKFRLVCDYSDGEDTVSFQTLRPRNILYAYFLCTFHSYGDIRVTFIMVVNLQSNWQHTQPK
jgi:hypothetical protein